MAPTRAGGSSKPTHEARRPATARNKKNAPERPTPEPQAPGERSDRPTWSGKGPRGPQKPRRAGKADRLSRLASSKKLRGLMRKQPLTPDQKPGGGVRKPKA